MPGQESVPTLSLMDEGLLSALYVSKLCCNMWHMNCFYFVRIQLCLHEYGDFSLTLRAHNDQLSLLTSFWVLLSPFKCGLR